jgi:hypothetical protein
MNVECDVSEFRPVFAEAASRPIRHRQVEIVELEANETSPPRPLAIQGAITLYLARSGAPILGEIREALKVGGQLEQDLANRLQQQFDSRPVLPIKEAVEVLVREPVFADLCYGKSTIAQHLCVPDGVDVAHLVFPYNGGRLAASGFTLVERFRDGETASLDALLVRNSPALSAAEKAALAQVPADQNELNVGLAYDCEYTTVAVTVVAAAAACAVGVRAALVATSLCAVLNHQHIPEEAILELGPAASARELLKLRRDVLARI